MQRSLRNALAAFVTLMLLCSVLVPVAAAEPAPSPEARERFERGIDLFRQGDHGGALAQFQRAYELAPYSVVLYNIGLSYAELGRPVEAVDTMAKVLAAPGSLSSTRLDNAKAVRAAQEAQLGSLAIKSNVDGAQIDVDGTNVAKTPLSEPLRLKAGPHRITAILGGYAPSRKEVDVVSGTTTELTFELVATESRLAHLTLHTRLPGATVLIDDQPVGTTPLSASLTVMPGQRTVAIARKGYVTARTTLTIGDGASAEVTLEPQEDTTAIAAIGGQLAFAVSEDEAVLTVDGVSKGPVKAVRLAPGKHNIRLERGGFFPVERVVNVGSGENASLAVEFEPTPETRADYVSDASTVRVLAWIATAGGVALVGGGVVFLVVNGGQKDDAEQAVLDYNAASDPGGRCDAATGVGNDDPYCAQAAADRLNSDLDAANGRDVIGFIGIGVGAAAIVAGTIMFIAGDDPGRYDIPESDQWNDIALRPVLRVDRGSGFIGIDGRF